MVQSSMKWRAFFGRSTRDDNRIFVGVIVFQLSHRLVFASSNFLQERCVVLCSHMSVYSQYSAHVYGWYSVTCFNPFHKLVKEFGVDVSVKTFRSFEVCITYFWSCSIGAQWRRLDIADHLHSAEIVEGPHSSLTDLFTCRPMSLITAGLMWSLTRIFGTFVPKQLKNGIDGSRHLMSTR